MEEVELIISVNQKHFFDSKNPEISTVSLVVNEENEPALKLSLDKEVINRNYEEETENNLSEVKKFIEESFHKSGMANIFEKVDPESLREIVNYIYNLEVIEAVKIASRYNNYGYLENVFNRDKLEELGFTEKDFEGKSSSEKIQLVYDRFGIDGVQSSLSHHSLERSLEYLILKQDIDIANSAVPEIELQKLYEEGGLKRASEILGENVDEYYYSNGIKGLQDYYEASFRKDIGKTTGYEEYISSFRQYLSIRDIGPYSIDGKEITISLPRDRDQALETLYKLFNVSRYPVSLENPNLKKFNKPIIENYPATERAIRNHYDKINEKPKILSDRVEVYENGTALIRAVPESVHDNQVSGPEGAAAADVQIYSVFIYPSSQEDVNDLYEAVVKAVLRAERYNDPLKGELYIDYFENRVYLPPHGFFKEYNNRFSEPAVQIHNGAVVIREMNLDDLRSFYNEMKDYVEPSFEIAQDIQKAIKGEYRG